MRDDYISAGSITLSMYGSERLHYSIQGPSTSLSIQVMKSCVKSILCVKRIS